MTAQQPGFWPQPEERIPPGRPASPESHTPSGLFPSGQPVRTSHPTYREPHPVRGAAVAAGSGSAACWLLVFGLLGSDLRGYVWWTAFSGGVAWLVALALSRFGDRGVAVGVAMVTAAGWSTAAVAVAVRWISSGVWPL